LVARRTNMSFECESSVLKSSCRYRATPSRRSRRNVALWGNRTSAICSTELWASVRARGAAPTQRRKPQSPSREVAVFFPIPSSSLPESMAIGSRRCLGLLRRRHRKSRISRSHPAAPEPHGVSLGRGYHRHSRDRISVDHASPSSQHDAHAEELELPVGILDVAGHAAHAIPRVADEAGPISRGAACRTS
jgi:hypothetical protein